MTFIHVAEVSSFLASAQRYGPRPLTPDESDRYYDEVAPVALALGRLVGATLGSRGGELPPADPARALRRARRRRRPATGWCEGWPGARPTGPSTASCSPRRRGSCRHGPAAWAWPDDLLQLAWTQAWQLAVLAVAIAVVVKLACRRRPHLAYLLWMLVIIKAITPPVWSSPTGAFSWAMKETIAERTLPASVPGPPALIAFTPVEKLPASTAAVPPAAKLPTPAPASQPAVSVSIGSMLLTGWCAGSLGLAMLLLVRWISLLRQLRQTSQSASAALGRQFDALRQQLGLRRPVRLVVTTDNLGPAAFGWWRGTVLVPQAVVEQSQPSELAAILAHELVHVRRFDPLIGSLQLAVQCLWWFHPAVWWANRELRVERECVRRRSAGGASLPAGRLRSAAGAHSHLAAAVRASRVLVGNALVGCHERAAAACAGSGTFHRRAPRWCWLVVAVALVTILPGAGRTIVTASPPDGQSAPATPANPIEPAELPTVPEKKVRETTAAEVEAMRLLGKRECDGTMRRWSGCGETRHVQQELMLPSSSDPGDVPLPLAAIAHDLAEVSVGQYSTPRPRPSACDAAPFAASCPRLRNWSSTMPPKT